MIIRLVFIFILNHVYTYIVHEFPVISKHGWDLVTFYTWCGVNFKVLNIEHSGYFPIVT